MSKPKKTDMEEIVDNVAQEAEQETEQEAEQEFERTAMTLDDLRQRVSEKITHKLKEGEEITGVYLGSHSVTTQYGTTEQHQFKVGKSTVFYWSNLSFSSAIVEAELQPMEAVKVRRFKDNTYVIDRL